MELGCTTITEVQFSEKSLVHSTGRASFNYELKSSTSVKFDLLLMVTFGMSLIQITAAITN